MRWGRKVPRTAASISRTAGAVFASAMTTLAAFGVLSIAATRAMADLGARERGLPVIAVTSIAHSLATASGHSSGARLMDHADIVIDLGTPPGDSLVEIDGPENSDRALLSLAALIEDAVRRDRIAMALQPIVSLPQRKTRSYETLCRIRTDDGAQIAAAAGAAIPDRVALEVEAVREARTRVRVIYEEREGPALEGHLRRGRRRRHRHRRRRRRGTAARLHGIGSPRRAARPRAPPGS